MKYNFNYNKFNVPILSDEDIEKFAYNLISDIGRIYLDKPMVAPVSSALEYIKKTSKVKIIFTDNMGKHGNKYVVGRVIFSKNEIYILKNIVNKEKIFNFTACHEIGHWLLHRHKEILLNKEENNSLDKIDDNKHSFSIKRKLKSPRDWIEHHANVFASSFLLPRNTLKIKLVQLQKERNIIKNIGKIYLDNQPENYRNYIEIKNKLSEFFMVSKKVIEIRMEKLEMIIDERKPECFSYF